MRARQPFDRLRELLRAQVDTPLAVSDAPRQWRFGDDFAGYAEIDVRTRSTDEFVIVVVRGYLPEDAFIAKVWHKRAPEVWLVDPDEAVVARVGRDGTGAILDVEQTLTTPLLPGVSIPVSALFVSH
jgi:hypothetical protein